MLRVTRVAVLLLSLLASGLAAQERIPVRILVPQSTAGLPLMRLAARDSLPGYALRCEVYLNHPQALALLLRGDADLLLSGTSQGWENYLGGGPLVLVNTGIWGTSSLVGAPGASPVRRLADLAGRRVALPFPGSPLDFQTRCMLVLSGLDPDRSLRLTYLAFGQSMVLLLQGQLDAVPFPEPQATLLVETRRLPRLLDYSRAWAEVSGGDPRSPQVSLFATRAWSCKNSSLLRALVSGWRRSSEEVTADPTGAAGLLAEALDLPAEVAEKSIGHTLFWVPEAEKNRRRVMEYYETVKSYLPGERGELGREFFFEDPAF
jgi:ABC-type nitrate/sulfonate/bicarbonate transport system substrate-binding protein